jgi:hypothetical protein
MYVQKQFDSGIFCSYVQFHNPLAKQFDSGTYG